MNAKNNNIQTACPYCKTVFETTAPIGNEAIACPVCGKRFIPVPETANPKGKFPWRLLRKRYVIIILAVLALIFLFSMCSGDEGMTVDEMQSFLQTQWDELLSDPNNALNKRIENAHITVTIQSAHVVRCDCETIDGSDRAGENGENIKTLNMLIRFKWEGIIESGYTDLRVIYDHQNDRWHSAIEYTTALVNIEDPQFLADVICGFIAGL